MAAVVDTDVVSYLFKGDSRAGLYRDHLRGNLSVVSFMTVAELDGWALARGWDEGRKERMERYLGKSFVVYPASRALCRKWAEVTDEARRRGRPIGVADAWIAATALLNRIPLITHNREHFAQVEDLEVVSEAP